MVALEILNNLLIVVLQFKVINLLTEILRKNFVSALSRLRTVIMMILHKKSVVLGTTI